MQSSSGYRYLWEEWMCPLITEILLKKRTFYCYVAFISVNYSIFIFLYLLHWSVYITVKQIFAFKGQCLYLCSLGTDVGLSEPSVLLHTDYRLFLLRDSSLHLGATELADAEFQVWQAVFPLAPGLWCPCVSPGTGDRAVGRELGGSALRAAVGHCEGTAQPGTCCTRYSVQGLGFFLLLKERRGCLCVSPEDFFFQNGKTKVHIKFRGWICVSNYQKYKQKTEWM